MKKAVFPFLFVLLFLSGCGGTGPGYVKIKGSETVLPISLELAERFTNDKDLVDVSVTAGGSGVGIAALLNGNTDIAMSSRDMKFEEKVKFAEQKLEYEEVTIGLDALALIVHRENPLDSITLQQAKDIYQGKITNWKQLGGPDGEIVAFNRESSSGTYEFFKKKVLNKEDFAQLQTVGANGELTEKVSDNPLTIGYVGIAYVNPKRVKTLKVYNEEKKASIAPTISNSLNKTYPLVRPLFFYYLKRDEAKVKQVIDYIKSQKGQLMVKSVGYPPNPKFYKP